MQRSRDEGKIYQLIDSHAHLDEITDLNAVISRARESGIIAIIANGLDYRSNCYMLEIAEKYKHFVYPALGFHPDNLDPDISQIEHNLQFIEANIENIVAIGEIGLDYKKEVLNKSSKDFQKGVLKNLLSLAGKYHKPVILHTRYAWRDSLTLVEEARIERAVFHWYTGPISVLKDIVSRNYFISASLAAEYHEEHRNAIKEITLENLLLETDTPVTYRGHQAEPADVVRSLKAVAAIKGLSPEIVAQKTTENAMRLFGISRPA